MDYRKIFLISILFCQSAMALPFNDDMVDSQIKTGQTMRSRPADTVPLGYENWDRPKKGDDVKTLVAPFPTDQNSIARGKRLFYTNCYPCHGKIGEPDYQPMPAGQQMAAPNISDVFYHDRTPGMIFGTILNGNVIMPALGYKLSNNEVWDIVHYVKQVQATAGKKE